MGSNDEVNHPQHYQLFPDMEAFDVIKRTLSAEELRGYLKGNILKYRLRAGKKGDAEKCVAKADWYSQQLFDAPSPEDDALTGIDIPKWAQWLAQDADGKWHAYKERPTQTSSCWDADGHDSWGIYSSSPNPNWRHSLRQVPR